jgi:transposase
VLCVDEKSQIQALDRTAPTLPTLSSTPARRSHDYVRNGTSSLFAALDVASGKVISSLHRRHRHQEFLKFLKTIDAAVPAELDVHLVCDNYATHNTEAIKTWFLRHPRFHLHFTPTYSSWLNLVERWFAELTTRKLRRSAHRSVADLESDITAWIQAWNEDPRPFVWTKTADEILDNLARYLHLINKLGTLVRPDHRRARRHPPRRQRRPPALRAGDRSEEGHAGGGHHRSGADVSGHPGRAAADGMAPHRAVWHQPGRG